MYYNNGNEKDEIQHSVSCESMSRSLGKPYQNFVEMEHTRNEHKNLVTLIKRAEDFAVRQGLDNKLTERSIAN